MNTHENSPNQQHVPVLRDQVLDVLAPKPGESYLDLTSGYGGHARAVIDITGTPESAVLVDRDQNALDSTKDLQDLGASPIHSDFAQAAVDLAGEGRTFNMILADLGVSSPHLDNADRGFSFSRPGPLDMRMDQSKGMSARELLNSASQDSLASILREFGEEPRADKIAKEIVRRRPLSTTSDLVDIVESTVPRRHGSKKHPATRTFQAVRMAVNNEIEQLGELLEIVEGILTPGGRLAIISFHSLEDRIVKTFFNERCKSGYESTMELITRKPILGAEESETHPRSRSAVLRAAVKK